MINHWDPWNYPVINAFLGRLNKSLNRVKKIIDTDDFSNLWCRTDLHSHQKRQRECGIILICWCSVVLWYWAQHLVLCPSLDLPWRRTLHSQRGNAAAPQSITGQLLRGVFPAPGPSVRGGARGGERRGGLVHPFHDVQAQSQLLLPPDMQPIDLNPPVFSSLPVSHADSETALPRVPASAPLQVLLTLHQPSTDRSRAARRGIWLAPHRLALALPCRPVMSFWRC